MPPGAVAISGKLWARQDGELLLKALERKAKLSGADAPVESTVNVVIEDLSDDDLHKQLAAEGYVFTQLNPPIQTALPEHIEEAEVTNVGTEGHSTTPAEAGSDSQRA
jgi:hypothetical protein